MSATQSTSHPLTLAHMLRRQYGLRAAAIASAHAAELEAGSDAVALAKWRQVQLAVADFRATAPGKKTPTKV